MIRDIRDYIASLEIAEDGNCYSGVLPNKPDKAIGVYTGKQGAPLRIPLGGYQNASYEAMPLTFLVHWTKSPGDTEEAAKDLYIALANTKNRTINNKSILFVLPVYDHPVSVGQDDNGTQEYVIDCIFYVRKEG